MIRHTVPDIAGSMSLQRYLSRAYPMLHTREILKKRDVKVNGARQSGDYAVRAGDELTIYADADFSIPVAGISGGLLAAVKPQGLPVDIDSDGIGADTALTRVRLICPEAKLCHRLDAQTGGVLIFALDDDTYAKALAAFKDRVVGKSYTAIVSGSFGSEEGTYRDYLVKDASRAEVRITGRRAGALPVETRWRVMRDLGDGLYETDLDPVTGRTHQLRAHMAYHGHPVLGDDKYGDRTKNRALRTKLCLWCRRIDILGAAFTAEAPDWLNRG